VNSYQLDTLSDLELINLNAEHVTCRARSALRLTQKDMNSERKCIAILRGSTFKNGVLETEIAGLPRERAFEGARGFVGIAFHVRSQGRQFEYLFIRPTNGRADDQLRRNHSMQYCSRPDHPWFRLPEESPGVNESYTDLVVDEWTRIKIVVSGVHAELYVNGAEQPCLIVNDLKLGETQGQIALWVGGGTEAHFSELMVMPFE
jgi:hypothetical protein